MNVSSHATMRYLQKVLGEVIINDLSFVTWKKCNPERVTDAEKEIQAIFKKINYTITGDFSNEHKGVVNYSICWEHKLIFVYDKDLIITIYQLIYNGLEEDASEAIFKILISELDKARQHLLIEDGLYSEYRKEYDARASEYKLEAIYIQSLQDTLRLKKEALELDNKVRLSVLDSKKKSVNILESKIVRPIEL